MSQQSPLTPEDLAALRAFTTPTVCNAIETFKVRPRGEGFMGPEIKCWFPSMSPMVGYAATAIIRASNPPPDPLPVKVTQLWEHVASVPGPRVLVVQDIDDRPVVPDHKAKSLSHETTFAEDITDVEALRGWLLDLTRQVAARLRTNQLRGRTVHLKIRFANFRTITRSHTFPKSTDVTQELWNVAAAMLTKNLPFPPLGVRLLGFSVSGFDNAESRQADMFCESENEKNVRLDTVSDWIQKRFGPAALSRAAELMHAAD